MKAAVSVQESREEKDGPSKKAKSNTTACAKAAKPQPEKEETQSEACSDVPEPDVQGEGEEEEEEAAEDDSVGQGGSEEEDPDLFQGPFATPSEGASAKKDEEHPRWQGLPNKTRRLQRRISRDLLGSLPVSLSRTAEKR